MAYPTVLVHLDDDVHAESRNELAIRPTLRFGSHLNGLSCRRPLVLGAQLSVPAAGIDDALTLELHEARRQASEREQRFRAQCDRGGMLSFETEIDDAEEPGRALLRRAAVHDLLVLGQPDPGDPLASQRRAIVEDVLLHSPRPTLVVPHAGRFEDFGHEALLAWDGSHGAARAVADALPILRRARAVHVVQFDRHVGQGGGIEPASLRGVVRWLGRHGIEAQGDVRYTGVDIGNALLSHAADVGADLLVMGCWGHARWAERLLGGATRTVMATMTVPVLTSH